MKRIPLTQGKVALVDDADFDWLNQWEWSAWKPCKVWYAVRGDCKGTYLMHREILSLKKGDGKLTDHNDHNGLNNQRYNIIVCNKSQNSANAQWPKKGKSSHYKGVSWAKWAAKWVSQIHVLGNHIHIGYYSDEMLAAKAYDKAAKHYFGKFACINVY